MNSDLSTKIDVADIPYKIGTVEYYASNFTASGSKYYHDFTISNTGGKIPKLFPACRETTEQIEITFTGITTTAFRVWINKTVANAVIGVLVLIPK